jgi:hypothetical protein
MKRHHIVAMFSFISGGLFAYIQFHHGDTGRAIRTGIICTLLGVVVLFYEKLRSWLRPVGVAVPLIFIGLMAAHAAFTGDIAAAIFLCIMVIGGGVCYFFQDAPFVKDKLEPYIGIIILLIMTLFLLFDAFSSL